MSASSSNGVKHGFFGYLKGLFRRNNDVVEEGGYETAVLTDAAPLVPPPVEIAAAAAAVTHAAPAPAPVVPVNPNLDTLGGGITPGIAIPLQAVLNGLAPELRERVRVQAVGDMTMNIAIDKVLAQLSQGQVRIPFGDIRKAAPHVFTSGSDFDRISVALPLNEVLSRINPALLVRRPAARQVEVPEEISSPFAGKGEGLSLSVGNTKPVQPAAPQKAAPAPQAPVRGTFSSAPRQMSAMAAAAADIPAPFAFAPKAAAPAAAQQTPAPAPVPFAPAAQLRTASPFPAAAAAPIPTASPIQPVSAAPVVAKPAATSSAVLMVNLNVLIEAWPESLRMEICQANLEGSRLALPVDAVETSLKRGRITFNWKTIRSWITPAVSLVSVNDAAELELPLKVIAPLFLARKHAGPQQKVAVDESIPNLFFGFPQPEAAAPVSAPAPAPAKVIPLAPSAPASPITLAVPVAPFASTPVAQASAPIAPQSLMPSDPIPFNSVAPTALTAAAAASSAAAAAAAKSAAAAAALATGSAKPQDTNFYLWDEASETTRFHIEALKQKGSTSTEFVKRYASPNDIVARAASLDGVAGVLIALPDGLMVASRIPADQNGDTLAAFLPQIFAKVSSCTKELRMGELNNVSFTVGNTPWKIFRVNAIFFAAFGFAARPMPTAELAALAAELDRKK